MLWSRGDSRAKVEEHSEEAYAQLKALAAATRTRFLHHDENIFRLMPETRYSQFMKDDMATSACHSEASFHSVY